MKALHLVFALLLLGSPAWGLQIELDYTYDAAGTNFFGTNSAARQSLERAAADLSALIATPLGAVATDIYTGQEGDTVATMNWSAQFSRPTNPNNEAADVTLQSFSLPANVFRVYVGMAPLGGTTLGQGGPAGFNPDLSLEGFEDEADAALAAAAAASNAAMLRGGGPTIGHVIYPGSEPLKFAYGALMGSLTFDNDTDNNGAVDSASRLNQYWNFNLATLPSSTQNDFYSVALHELLHTLGMGTSETWLELMNGTTWLGAHANALRPNGGVGLVTEDGHIASNIMSTRLFDGASQEVAMDPTLTTGQRKYLTALDAAFLRDLGYATVPEPTSVSLWLCGLAMLANMVRHPHGRLGKI